MAFCGDFVRIQDPWRRHRQVFGQRWIAIEDFIDFEDRTVHLPEGIRKLLFVCHEALMIKYRDETQARAFGLNILGPLRAYQRAMTIIPRRARGREREG
jgi:hypothetical protein